jgi:hypothetical protein
MTIPKFSFKVINFEKQLFVSELSVSRLSSVGVFDVLFEIKSAKQTFSKE